MTAQTALKTALRDIVGPAAREQGFKGSAPTWRKTNARGDWAAVNVQSSSFSSAEHLRCIINLAVAPAPWLAWMAHVFGTGPRKFNESMGLFRDRLHPSGTPGGMERWWDVYDEGSAQAVARDMVAQLAAGGWPVLERLLDRAMFMDQLAIGELGDYRRESLGVLFARAEAVLLMEEGPSKQLDRALHTALEGVIPEQQQTARAFDSWVRERASQVTPE